MKNNLVLLTMAVLVMGCLACGSGGGSGGGGTPSGLSAGFNPEQPNPAANSVAADEDSSSGELVTVEITLTDISGVYGASFDLTYDADAADFIEWDSGTLFEQGGHSPIYTVNETVNGQLVVVVTRQGPPATSSVNAVGTQTILELTFRMEEAGSFATAFQSNSILDNQPLPQPKAGVQWFAGALTAD